jgi:SH3 domain protein
MISSTPLGRIPTYGGTSMGVKRGMNLKVMLFFAPLIVATVLAGLARADRRYISDRLIVSLRAAPEKDGMRIRTLISNTPVEVVEESGQYLKVRTEQGEEGWIEKRYISSELPKPIIIDGLKKEIDQLQARIRDFEAGKNPLADKLKAVEERHFAKVRELEEHAAKLAGDRSKLQKSNDRLHNEIERLNHEIARHKGTGKLQWFLAGAAVFCLGLIAGHVTRRKKRYYIDL